MEWIGGIINDSPVNRFIIGDNEVNVTDTRYATIDDWVSEEKKSID